MTRLDDEIALEHLEAWRQDDLSHERAYISPACLEELHELCDSVDCDDACHEDES